MITLTKRIFRDELRTLCINKDWYTEGNIKEYDNLFDKLHDDMTDDEILDIIVYEVFSIVHTFVKR